MENISKVILTFKDQRYPLAKVRAKGMSGAIATVAVAELNFSPEALAMVTLSEDCPELHGGSVIIFKHEGRWIVFGGRDQVQRDLAKGKTHIAGHILTMPALKSVRIEQHRAAEPVQVEALVNKFSPPPVRTEVRAPRKSYDKPSGYPRQTPGQPLHARSSNTRSGS
jgi:hypothetical protein